MVVSKHGVLFSAWFIDYEGLTQQIQIRQPAATKNLGYYGSTLSTHSVNVLSATCQYHALIVCIEFDRLWWVSSTPFGIPFCLPVQF